MFVVAVGSSPAESLLVRLAQETGGAAEFVTPKESIEDALMRLLGRLRQPRAKDVRVRWPVEPEWTAPVQRALFDGETLHAMARFGARPEGEMVLEWCDERAQAHRLSLPDQRTQAPIADDAVPRVAAGLAMTLIPEREQGAFAQHYQLVTSLTSMVLVLERDEGERNEALPTSVKVPQMLAAGWGGAGSVLAASMHCISPGLYDASCDMDVGSLQSPNVPLSDALEQYSQPGLDYWFCTHWQPSGGSPKIASLAGIVPEEWIDVLRELAAKGEADEPALVAWVIIEFMSRTPKQGGLDRAALRDLRRAARRVPDCVAVALRARLQAPAQSKA